MFLSPLPSTHSTSHYNTLARDVAPAPATQIAKRISFLEEPELKSLSSVIVTELNARS